MKAIYLDCFAGISGNMMLGAFIDGGVPEDYLKSELGKLNIDEEFCLRAEKTVKSGIQATYVSVQLNHSHERRSEESHHHHHDHRHLSDIAELIEKSALSDAVKRTSVSIFRKIAAAEAKVHGKSIEEVHFHEVGAVDSIVDIVGTAICLDYLQIEKIYVSKLNVGGGFVQCAHGLMPVPAPATAELLKGIPFYQAHAQKELVTPTGAGIVAALADLGSFEFPQEFSYETVSYGAGTWELSLPNALRMYIGTIESGAADAKKK